jgi:DNA-binding MarR family transcriptional regulator
VAENVSASDLAGGENLVELVVDAGLAVQRAIEKSLLSLELGFAQQRLLAFLLHAEGPLTPTNLSLLLLQETHSTSGLLNRLDDRGLVIRSHDRQDRRVVSVKLTPAGRALAEESSAIVQKILSSCEEWVETRDRAKTAKAVEAVRDSAFRLAGARQAKTRDDAIEPNVRTRHDV